MQSLRASYTARFLLLVPFLILVVLVICRTYPERHRLVRIIPHLLSRFELRRPTTVPQKVIPWLCERKYPPPFAIVPKRQQLRSLDTLAAQNVSQPLYVLPAFYDSRYSIVRVVALLNIPAKSDPLHCQMWFRGLDGMNDLLLSVPAKFDVVLERYGHR